MLANQHQSLYRGCAGPRHSNWGAKGKPSFNQRLVIWNWVFGGACAGLRPAFKRGHDNGLRPGRTGYPNKSRHHEAALSSIKSDDIATQGAQANDNRPRRRTSDPEFRADQETCGTVGPTTRANRLTLAFQARSATSSRRWRVSRDHAGAGVG